MSVGIFKKSGEVEGGEWYNLAATDVTYTFPVLNFEAQSIIYVKVFGQTATTPSVTVRLLDSSDTILATETTRDYDSGSSVNPGELIIAVPVGSAKIRFNTNTPAFAYVQVLQFR